MKEGNYMFFFFDEDPEGNALSNYSEKTFEDIKHIDSDGNEFWYARELWKVLGYTEFNKFEPVIKKAITACWQTTLHKN